jgi:hypothetical protein
MAAGIYDDSRSRDKGVEPEGMEIMRIGDRLFAFVGLERTLQAAIAAFDITDPEHASFVRLLISNGDRAPEGLKGYQANGHYYLRSPTKGPTPPACSIWVPSRNLAAWCWPVWRWARWSGAAADRRPERRTPVLICTR